MKFKFHPIADCFPLMEGKELESLVDDIKKNGVLEPLVIYEDRILDGRNRWRAATKAGIDREEIDRVDYTGDDPVGFVVSRNLNRRHMSTSERAIAAAKLAKLKHGQTKAKMRINTHLSQDEAAERMNVSRESVQNARVVVERGMEQLVRDGEKVTTLAKTVRELEKSGGPINLAKVRAAVKAKKKPRRRLTKEDREEIEQNKLESADLGMIRHVVEYAEESSVRDIVGRAEDGFYLDNMIKLLPKAIGYLQDLLASLSRKKRKLTKRSRE